MESNAGYVPEVIFMVFSIIVFNLTMTFNHNILCIHRALQFLFEPEQENWVVTA